MLGTYRQIASRFPTEASADGELFAIRPAKPVHTVVPTSTHAAASTGNHRRPRPSSLRRPASRTNAPAAKAASPPREKVWTRPYPTTAASTLQHQRNHPRRARTAIATYYRRTFELTGDKKQNRARLESAGYLFSEKIVGYTLSGNVVVLDELSEKDKLNVVRVEHVLNTHSDGREYHNRVGRIGLEIGLEYRYVNTIVGKLFGDRFEYRDKLLSLSAKRLYAFVINNFDLLRRAFREAMAIQLAQGTFPIESVSEKPFTIPQSTLFTYDLQNRIQTESVKNVYQGYLMSAEKRSSSEKQFEKYCENSPAVDWFYKNGDKGDEYFSILYLDNSNRQKLFYPDYIVSVRGKVWIIETKGGFSKAGDSEDIDIFSPKKFEVLKAYLAKYGLKGGFVRCDKQSEELCICTDNYNDDIHSSAWSLLGDIIR